MLSYLAASPYTGALPAGITQTLWAQHPVEVSMDAVRLSFMDSSVPPSLVLVALNGKRFVGFIVFSEQGGPQDLRPRTLVA